MGNGQGTGKQQKKGVILIKHGKNPSVKQGKLMQKWGLDYLDWLVVKDTPTEMLLVHRFSDKTIKVIPKE